MKAMSENAAEKGSPMPYLIDYLESQLASFDDAPFNAVDAAVLSQMCMIRGEGIVPELKEAAPRCGMFGRLQESLALRDLRDLREKPVGFRDLLRAERFEGMFTGLDPVRIKSCLFAAASSPRYRSMLMREYRSLFDEDREMQFAAVSFVQGRECSVVAFRGTDTTRTGWKEDFNMAFSAPVPAQREALRYLEEVAPKLPGKLYVIGHSKGGNLAEYAALKAAPELQARIERVYVLDGPGFKEGVFDARDYAPIMNRLCKMVPEDSIIGVLMDSPVPLHVVPSNARGLSQHSVFTWEIDLEKKPAGFVELEGLSDGALFTKEVLDEWLGRHNDVERLILVDLLFRTIDASGAESVPDFISGGARTAELFREALRNLDEEDRELLGEAGRELAEIAGSIATRRFGENMARGIAAGASQAAQGIAAGSAQVAQSLADGAAQIARSFEQAAADRRALKEKEEQA